MVKNFVIDTVALGSYFRDIFNDSNSQISKKALDIIEGGFNDDPNIRLSIPSVVFIEIYYKTFIDEEARRRFQYEVYELIKSKNIEITPIDQDVLENFVKIGRGLENHDRIILASAMALECPIITHDSKISEYLETNRVVKLIS
jgi:PIN domain nuclease of toxin-antitoxin system